MGKVFVSHAAKDKALVEEFVDLLHLGVGVPLSDIFCSSLPGMGIPTGADFVQHIKDKVKNPEFVLFLISEDFLKSAFCLNEVGATWALSIQPYPLLVPPLDYSRLGGVLSGKQASRLDDKDKLNDLRDDLIERLKLTPYRTSHWERVRDKFLARLRDLVGNVGPITGGSAKRSGRSAGVIDSSGSLLKLNNSYFEAERVSRPEKDKIAIELFSQNSDEEVVLDRLRPGPHGRGAEVPFAYQNDGGLVRIESVQSTSHGGKHHWTISVARVDRNDSIFSEMNVQNHSADEIAEMRAGRLLINNPPPPKKRRGFGHDDIVEYAIQGQNDSAVKVEGCIVSAMFKANSSDPDRAMKLARLEAVFRLKATRTIESIFELVLGPVSEKTIHVKFRGPRHARGGEEAETIAIEGDCPLD